MRLTVGEGQEWAALSAQLAMAHSLQLQAWRAVCHPPALRAHGNRGRMPAHCAHFGTRLPTAPSSNSSAPPMTTGVMPKTPYAPSNALRSEAALVASASTTLAPFETSRFASAQSTAVDQGEPRLSAARDMFALQVSAWAITSSLVSNVFTNTKCMAMNAQLLAGDHGSAGRSRWVQATAHCRCPRHE